LNYGGLSVIVCDGKFNIQGTKPASLFLMARFEATTRMDATHFGFLMLGIQLLLFSGGWAICGWLVRDLRHASVQFSMACLVGCIALSLHAARGFYPSWLTDVGGQILGLLTIVTMWRAVLALRVCDNHDREQLVIFLGVSAVLCGLWFYPEWKPVRILIVNAAICWMVLRLALTVRTALRESDHQKLTLLIESVGIAFILAFMGRTVYTFLQHPQRMSVDHADAGALLVVLLAMVIFTIFNGAFANVVIVTLIRQLKSQARLDSMTGLINRRGFEENLTKEWAVYKRNGGNLALLEFDVDHFKLINDTHGHVVGDVVLNDLAKIARKHVRLSDTLARVGGEEFVILMPGAGEKDAFDAAERLRQAVEKAQWIKNARVTVSVGVTVAMPSDSLTGEMVTRADLAMYKAKAEGRNRSVLVRDAPESIETQAELNWVSP
jgi:diguanylate cyclase (GGDEF)-like protein